MEIVSHRGRYERRSYLTQAHQPRITDTQKQQMFGLLARMKIAYLVPQNKMDPRRYWLAAMLKNHFCGTKTR